MRFFCNKKILVLISLIFIVALAFSPFISLLSCRVSFFAIGAEATDKVVKNETELGNAISVAPSDNTPYTISLNDNIALKNSLEIPNGKNITLTGMGGVWKLVGANNLNTINVVGLLTIDGVIVTHAKGDAGRGVYVNDGGTLTLLNGEISCNTILESGGGVYIERGGSFEMLGGVISDNTANNVGGGVWNEGTFCLSGGVISNNYSGSSGGGVANIGIFVMSGGKISKNTAPDGGGVSNSGGYGRGVTFTMTGGEITGNTAEKYCGGVFYPEGSFDWRGGVISGNTAGIDGNDASSTVISWTPVEHSVMDERILLIVLIVGVVAGFATVSFFFIAQRNKNSP